MDKNELLLTATDGDIFIYQHNLTFKWIDSIYEQMHRPRPNRIVEIDYNVTYVNPDLAEYLLLKVKTEIQHSFGLVSPELLLFFSILYGFIFFFGLMSNSLIIYSFYRSKKLRTFRNIFIVNLAVSDILLCSICAPLTLLRYIDLNWKLGRVLCRLVMGLQTANVLVSALSITAIAVDRWNFIVNSGKGFKNICLYLCICFIWIISFSISIPSFIVNDEKTFRIKQTQEVLYRVCEEIWESHNSKYIYYSAVILVQYFLPVAIVGSTNYKICNYLHLNVPEIFKHKTQKMDNYSISYTNDFKNQKRVLLNNNNNNKSTSNTERSSFLVEKLFKHNERYSRSKKILLLVFLTFSLCWLPITILNVILDFSELGYNYVLNGHKISVIILFSHSLAMLSSSLNPVLYGLLNKNFKQELSNLFKFKLPKSRKQLELARETISISQNLNPKNLKHSISNHTSIIN